MVALLTGFLAAGLGSCQGPRSQANIPSSRKPQAPRTAQPYDLVMEQTLKAYYGISRALAASDPLAADSAGLRMGEMLDTLEPYRSGFPVSDSTALRQSITSLQGELLGLLGERGLDGKRSEFSLISGLLSDLLSGLGWRGPAIYRDYSPSAFDGNGAFWLSPDTLIQNPYSGSSGSQTGIIRSKIKD